MPDKTRGTQQMLLHASPWEDFPGIAQKRIQRVIPVVNRGLTCSNKVYAALGLN